MNVEYIQDKTPMYVHNRHTTYENTVLQEHASIVSALKDTSTPEALLEAQGRLFIGLCKPGAADDFISKNYDSYYKNEFDKLDVRINPVERKSIASNRTWLRLINEAVNDYIKRYKVDGSKAKIAILDDRTTDGRSIVDADDLHVDYEE